MARDVAERVVAARYSPLETPFYKRMNFIFSGSETVYGFNELSPLGKHIRTPLRNYFNSINRSYGSYSQYLDREAYKRNKNEELFQQGIHSLNQAKVSEYNTERDFFRDKCLLYDSKAPFSSRVEALENIFSDGKAGSAFFAIDDFLSTNESTMKEGAGRKAFRSIRKNPSFEKSFLSYGKHLNHLPYIRMIYYALLDRFQWASPFDLQILKRETLLEIIKTPDQEAYSSVLNLLGNNQVSIGELYISGEEFSEDYVDDLWSLLIFDKLRVQAPDWQEQILKHCEENREELAMCYQALNTLAHIWPQSSLAPKLENLLDDEDDGVVYYSLRVLGQTKTNNYRIQRKMADFLHSNKADLRQEAIQALGFLRSPYADIQADLAVLLTKADDRLSEEILWSLDQIDVTGGEAQHTLLEYVLESQQEKPEFFLSAFRIFENSTSFSNSTLYFFYDILEHRENLDILFPVIETLAKNKHIKDIGIHYRFTLFQNEESFELKLKALESLSHLTWLHPEVQISFLNYLEEQDPRLRQATFQILRNIENLQPKTLLKIKTLSDTQEDLKHLL